MLAVVFGSCDAALTAMVGRASAMAEVTDHQGTTNIV
jgi:hypothetical protein